MSDEATYSFGAVAKILDLPESKLRYWAQVGFVGPSVRQGAKQVFSFQDLVSVKAAKELTDRGFSPADIRKALGAVRASLPHVDRPLDRVRVAWDGERLVVSDEAGTFEVTGQRTFDFGVAELAKKGAASEVHVMPGAAAAEVPGRGPYDWFMAGVELEAQAGRGEEAAACYRKALELDGGLAAAHTNLGGIAWRRGDAREAREAFETALALDPDQPEARFNLANLILEAGDLELAVAELRRVLQSAPDFADAHFNLAVALERLGGRAQARAHLEKYLGMQSEAAGPWSDQARILIERLAEP